MPQQSKHIQAEVLREVDELLHEYEEVEHEIQNLRRDALKLYAQVSNEGHDTRVAHALGRILEIPE